MAATVNAVLVLVLVLACSCIKLVVGCVLCEILLVYWSLTCICYAGSQPVTDSLDAGLVPYPVRARLAFSG